MNPVSIQLLRNMPIFGGLSDSALETVLGVANESSIAKNDYLFREGDSADSLFVLKKGQVSVQKRCGDVDVTLGHLAEGDCIGEMALIDFQPRSASVVALTDCQTIEVDSKSLRILMTADLMQYTLIMMNMGREVSRRLRTADERILELESQLQSE